MAYQPIQMPGLQIPDFASTILHARQLQQQQEQNRWSQLRDQGAQDMERQRLAQQTQHQQFEDTRQKTADAEGVRAQIQKLHDAGLGHQAQEFAKLHGLTFQAQPVTEQAPVAPEMPQVPTQEENPLQGPLIPGATDQNSQLMQAERDPTTDPVRLEEHAHQMMDVFPQQQAQYEQQAAAHDQRVANPIVNYSGPMGSFSVDPMEARNAQQADNERRAGVFQRAFANVPEMQQYVGPGAGMIAAGEDIKPHDIFDLASKDNAARAAAAKEESRIAHEKEFSPQALEQAKELARISASGRIAAAATGKVDSGNDKIFTLLDRRAKSLRDSTQFTSLVKGDKTVRGLMANIAEGTVPLQHGDAQIQLARYFRQAQPTEGEMHQLYSRLGGTMDKWNQFVAQMENGDLSPEQINQVRIASKAVQKEDAEDKKRFVEVARHYLGPKSGLDMVPDQAQNLFEGMAAELGLEGLPPLYDTEGGITLGSGKKPATKARAPQPAKSLNIGGKVVHYDAQGKRLP